MTGPMHRRALRAAGVEAAIAARALVLALTLAAAGPAHAEDAPIIVTVTGLRYAEGTVRVDVCTPETFLRSSCPYSASAPARIGETTVTAPHVPPGVYAIQAFHDFTNSGELDRGPLGIPREGLAFSNDAPLGLSGPSFARAAFTHGDAPTTLRLRLHRFRRAPTPGPPGGR
jgi:uncharacterized protein (DUF2141 family)